MRAYQALARRGRRWGRARPWSLGDRGAGRPHRVVIEGPSDPAGAHGAPPWAIGLRAPLWHPEISRVCPGSPRAPVSF